MKKFNIFLGVSLLCILPLISKTQNFIRLDASFYSQVLDEVKNIDIYLPQDYYVDTTREYASIYYLHGMGGNQNEGNINAMHYYLEHIADTTISSPPAIFVCPDASCEPYRGSYYMNSVLYGAYEDYIIQDVLGFVESNFRAIDNKNFRMITGMSMGGWGAARLGVKYPDKFRAVIPCSGYLAMPDTMMNFWRTTCYQENGSYKLNYNAGSRTQQYFTACGGLSPKMDIEPYYIEIPFDTLGNWVDTTLTKWYAEDPSAKVKALPDENELSWFLICGAQDDIICYPTYHNFTDSLEKYNIGYDHDYFEGGHAFNPESWLIAIHWADSIINLEYQTLSIGNNIITDSRLDVRTYPNPVQDICTIEFNLAKSEMLNIQFYNSMGIMIDQIGHRIFPPGLSRVKWNPGSLDRGIYFCRIQIGNNIVTKKILKVN